MKPYSRYRTTDSEWIGEIPDHWELQRLANFGEFLKGRGISKAELTETGLPAVIYGDLYTRYGPVIKEAERFIPEKLAKQSVPIQMGDLLFTGSGETALDIGRCAAYMSAEVAYAGGDLNIYRQDAHDSRFLSYCLNTPGADQEKARLSRGQIIVHIYQRELRELKFPCPPRDEQEAIVAFLDHQTGLIDELIEKNTKLLELLDDQRKAIINEAVTKGVGVDGSVQVGWHRTRLKHIGNLYSGLTGKSGTDFYQPEHPKSRPYIPFKNIAGGVSINPTMLDHVVIEEGEEQNQVRSGDIFFLMSSETYEDIARSSILLDDLEDTYLNSFCRGFRITDDRYDAPFINYYLQSSDARQRMAIEANGFTRINIQTGKVKNFEVVAPNSRKAQIEIRNFLDKQMALLDGIVLTTGQMMESLLDYRRSLISEAVTGKIDLREWVPVPQQTVEP